MRRNKFNAKRTVVDGLAFDSQREAKRWGELRLLEMGGIISDLRRQVPYPLKVNGHVIATYKADFVYCEGGREVVEDSKGVRTPEYKLKAKLMRAVYGIEILET